MPITLDGTLGITTPGITNTGNESYAGTLTGGTGVINIGSGQFYKDASGNVGIGTASPSVKLQVAVAPSASADNGMRVTDGTRIIQTNITGSAYSYIGIGANETMLYSTGNPLNIVSDGQPIKFIAGTAERMRIDSSGNVGIGVTNPGVKLAVNGAIAALAGNFVYYQNTATNSNFSLQNVGSTGTSALAFASDGTERMRIDSSGKVGIGTSSPQVRLDLGAGTTGQKLTVYNDNTNAISGFGVDLSGGPYELSSFVGSSAGGNGIFTWSQWNRTANTYSEKMRIDSSGNLLVGTTTSNGKLTVNGGVSANDFVVGQNVTGNLYVASRLVYDRTTAGAANVFVYDSSASYVLARSTSSIKYKKNVKNASYGLSEVLKLRPVTYEGISEIDGGKTFGGLIAEEVDEIGLKEFVVYREDDGTPDALAYGNMVSLAFKAIQEQQAMIENLTTRLTALEGK